MNFKIGDKLRFTNDHSVQVAPSNETFYGSTNISKGKECTYLCKVSFCGMEYFCVGIDGVGIRFGSTKIFNVMGFYGDILEKIE